MKHKRLNRDGWGFQYYPYYQMRIAEEILHNLCSDISKTNAWCAQIRQIVEDRIVGGEAIRKCREVIEKEKDGFHES